MSSDAVAVYVHPDVEAVQQLYAGVIGAAALERSCDEQVQVLVERLEAGHAARHRGAYVELKNWHPGLGDRSETEIWDLSLGPDDVSAVIRREHGYADPSDPTPVADAPSEAFETAVDAMLRGDIAELDDRLAQDAALARTASHWPHRATLLHYATANGVEIHRQVVPANLPDAVALVIEHGADVNATAFAYGGERRPLGLLLSSGHPHEAGVTAAVASILRANGAT